MFSNFKFKNMNTTLTSTLSPTLGPERGADDYITFYILVWVFACPALCFICVICNYNGYCSIKRERFRVIQTSSSEDELSRINNDYYNGA